MPSFMVMHLRKEEPTLGLGLKKFEVSPQKGDFLEGNDENRQPARYQVVAVVHPLESASNSAGDLYVRIVATGFEEILKHSTTLV